jgi:hypothetical protein
MDGQTVTKIARLKEIVKRSALSKPRPALAGYVFHTEIVPIVVLMNEEKLALFLHSSERVYCFVDTKDFGAIKNKEKTPKFEPIAQRQVGGSNVLLISNQ